MGYGCEAQTAVGFEFREDYSRIAHDVDNFTSLLQTDIRKVFTFTNTTEVSSTEVTSSPHGKIRVNFTLTIDTTIDSKIRARSHLEDSLRMEQYEFVFEGDDYLVNGSTVWIMNSFPDIWHQYAPEIAIAVICGLAALAIFVASVQLICMNRKRPRRASYVPRPSLPVSYSGNSLGRTNGGFMMEELNGGNRVHTPKSSIGSTRFFYDRDTLYDKLIYGAYEVPPKHMYDFL
ncbi:uncharacterized protein LOC119742603 isoform X2 [Patiria miniata]|uniref:Uncharacterized protein n=1 Tax=Patiria miniata TaxID=46514 RepID=A0A914BFD9_PATMI|nr:uncharacterized protein LOC119742603 isoform X2 [Patiria miniata]